jgi:hypothetical protein
MEYPDQQSGQFLALAAIGTKEEGVVKVGNEIFEALIVEADDTDVIDERNRRTTMLPNTVIDSCFMHEV